MRIFLVENCEMKLNQYKNGDWLSAQSRRSVNCYENGFLALATALFNESLQGASKTNGGGFPQLPIWLSPKILNQQSKLHANVCTLYI